MTPTPKDSAPRKSPSSVVVLVVLLLCLLAVALLLVLPAGSLKVDSVYQKF
jgi:hypothetical protein